MIDKESKKTVDCQLFAKIFHEIQFHFVINPPIVTLSDFGVNKYGLSKTIINPICDSRIIEIFGKEGLKNLKNKICKITPENPIIQYDCQLKLEQEKEWHRIACAKIWSEKKCLGVIGKVINIHEEKSELLTLQYMVSHDDLTGLLNRTHVKIKIQEILQNNPDREFVLIILDLDYFKSANDSYGHIFGDCLIKHVAEQLRKCIRDKDIAARIGGDEFLIFMENENGIEEFIQSILYKLTGKYHDFFVSISIGGAKTKAGERSYDILFHHADQALYAVKRAGRGYFRFYDSSMSDLLL